MRGADLALLVRAVVALTDWAVSIDSGDHPTEPFPRGQHAYRDVF